VSAAGDTVEVVDGVYADVPRQWSLDRTTSPTVLGFPGSGAAVQASSVAHPELREPSVGNARTGALDVLSFLQKKMGWRFVQATAEEHEAEDGSAGVWLDVSPSGQGDPRRFSVGRREWKDGSFVMTWIGEETDAVSCGLTRRVFDRANRARTA
jgi:hypothetical protein